MTSDPVEAVEAAAPELEDYDYSLPPERIAQTPAEARDAARLLLLDRDDASGGGERHHVVRDLPDLLAPGDLLVMNATRVVPARLRGRKASGGNAEALLLGSGGKARRWHALVRCRGRLRVGLALEFRAPDQPLRAEVVAVHEDGSASLLFDSDRSPFDAGVTPLPRYIRRDPDSPLELSVDRERYQTVYARVPGSVAAPTAGLHLTRELLDRLDDRGVEYAEVVLHVGPGTFRPLTACDLRADRLHPERFELSRAVADAVDRTRERGGRVVAVGTTSARVLEAQSRSDRGVRPGRGETDLLLRPGSQFRVVDSLLTNFHLPRSSLLLLVAAFGGRERILRAYAEAIRQGYRFYSYGDAMLIR